MNVISTSKMVHCFEAVAARLEAETGGPVHLIRIIGPRSSFIAGRVPGNMPFVASVRIMLDDQWALLFYPPAGRHIDQEKVKVMFANVARPSSWQKGGVS